MFGVWRHVWLEHNSASKQSVLMCVTGVIYIQVANLTAHAAWSYSASLV